MEFSFNVINRPIYAVYPNNEYLINPYEIFVDMAFEEFHMTESIDAPMKTIFNTKLLDKIIEKYMPKFNYTLEDGMITFTSSDGILNNFTVYTLDGYVKSHIVLSFDTINCFDFVGIRQDDNYLTVIESDGEHKLAQLIPIICMMGKFEDFLKEYKRRSLQSKNIEIFVNKFVKPVCENTVVVQHRNGFTISSAVGSILYKRCCKYDGYLNEIKTYAEELSKEINNHG